MRARAESSSRNDFKILTSPIADPIIKSYVFININIMKNEGLLIPSSIIQPSPPISSEKAITGTVEARRLSSSIVKQDYKLFIYLPESYTVNSDRTFPVVYQLDANNFFGSVTEIAQLLSFGPRFPGEANIPDFIIVGIGYDTKELRELMPLRNRDLTPVFQESHPNSGGSVNFLSFIKEELIPYIDINYNADPTDRTFSGISFGGLFAIYAMFHDPTTPQIFNRYIVGAPSLWFGNDWVFKLEEAYAKTVKTLPVRLSIAVGLEDNYEPEFVVDKSEEFVSILERRNYAGLQLNIHILEGYAHLSSFWGGFIKGILDVFK